MSKQSELFTFIVDDYKFTVTKSTINNYSSSHLCKVLNGTVKDNCIIVNTETNTVYIDRDPEAFAYIVDTLRGYRYDVDAITDLRLKHKVEVDLKYFGLCKTETPKSNTVVTEKDVDEIDNILKSSNETYNTDEVPLLTKFLELASKSQKTKSEKERQDELDTSSVPGPYDPKVKITDFLKSINEKVQGGGDPFELISALSTDENIKNMIIKNQIMDNNHTESDAESLDLDDETNNEADTKTSELITDISNKLSLHESTHDDIESLESILKPKSETKQNKTNYEKARTRYIQIN